MASLTKAKAVYYGAKIKRQSLPPISTSTDRSGLKAQDIPPELCHLTGDALAAPFPPIALGGYIRYYNAFPEQTKSPCNYTGSCSPWSTMGKKKKLSLDLDRSFKQVKTRRRASSASTLFGPLLSHTPMPSPSNEVPPRSHLFIHNRSRSLSEDTPSPVSPEIPQPSPRSRRRHLLSIIPEASRETMRSEMGGESISLPSTPRKPRVASYPSATRSSTTASLTTPTLSLTISSSTAERSSPLTPMTSSATTPLSSGGSLRRKKRQVLRTPSVENDFARSARELLGLGKKEIRPVSISREISTSSGSETTEDDGSLSPAMTVSTALTSVLDPSSLPPSPSSTTKPEEENGRDNHNHHDDKHLFARDTASSINSDPATRSTIHTQPSLESNMSQKRDPALSPIDLEDQCSESDANSSPTVSTPPTSFTWATLLDDEDLRKFVVLELVDDDNDEKRDSWASYTTATSCFGPLSIVMEADEAITEEDMRRKTAHRKHLTF